MVLKDILNAFISKEKNNSIAKTIQSTISNALNEFQERLQNTLEKAAKSMLLMLLSVVAFIFMLVGLSKYLSASVAGLADGLGFVVVGGGMLVLILVAHVLQKE